MATIEYLESIRMIIEDDIPLNVFVKLSGVDQYAAEAELQNLLPVAYTSIGDAKPIYFFKSCEYPNLAELFHWTKMFSFARGGSPYKDGSLSDYDFRKDYPYIQAGVYDKEKKTFVTGLRFLPLSTCPSFDMSAMHLLYNPTDMFVKQYMQNTIEIGQTFVVPDMMGANALMSIMSSVIAAHPEVRYLCGKPTIEGRIPDISKEIISAFAYDAFNYVDDLEFSSTGEPLFVVVDGIVTPPLRSLAEIVDQYNIDVGGMNPKLSYLYDMSIQKKRKLTERLLVYYGGALPPMFKFYAVLTEEKGMVILASSVVNPVYTTKAWEFPILLDKTKIIPLYKPIIDNYTKFFEGKTIHY